MFHDFPISLDFSMFFSHVFSCFDIDFPTSVPRSWWPPWRGSSADGAAPAPGAAAPSGGGHERAGGGVE